MKGKREEDPWQVDAAESLFIVGKLNFSQVLCVRQQEHRFFLEKKHRIALLDFQVQIRIYRANVISDRLRPA